MSRHDFSLFVIPFLLGIQAARSAEGPDHRQLTAVPFTAVHFSDSFWAPRLRTNREVSLPHNLTWCEQTGRINNFAKAGGLMPGEFEGIYFNDSDVYKVLEGASYSLADHPDETLEKQLDEIVAKIAAAQQKNGYLNTFYILGAPGDPRDESGSPIRWSNCRVRHELYCAGHLFEAAVAHHRATGKRSLLEVATRFADHIDLVFGPTKRHDVPGHEEIELGLIKLYELTEEPRYLRLAEFFLDIRGDEKRREKLYGPYCQDHKPAREQSEVVGHAVRAMYLYCGMADAAAYSGDSGLIDALGRLYDDTCLRKMYITGGIGARHQGEAFGDAYELPNASAYCETCAAIGLALWNHRMALLHGDARYADVVERAVYNGVLSGVSLSGDRFFYVNPLASSGKHHHKPFYPCACCPTNVVRFMPSLPGLVYARSDRDVYVNLYVAGKVAIPLAESKVTILQETRYPWDGDVKLTIQPEKTSSFTLRLRVPGWCEDAALAVNGKSIDALNMKKGYACLTRHWKAGDTVSLSLPMKIRRMEAHPRVEADRGRVAIQRGPIVYAFEAVDNPQGVQEIVLARDPQLVAEHRDDLLEGVTVIKGIARDGRPVMAVPYYAWDHREPGAMAVWVWQNGKSREAQDPDAAWQGKLYRPLNPATLGPSTTTASRLEVELKPNFSGGILEWKIEK